MNSTFSNRRYYRTVLDSLQAKLYLKGSPGTSSDVEITFRPVDISQAGLGLFIQKDLKMEDEYYLKLRTKNISLCLVWIEGSPNSYRCGFEVVDKSLDLTKVINAEFLA